MKRINQNCNAKPKEKKSTESQLTNACLLKGKYPCEYIV